MSVAATQERQVQVAAGADLGTLGAAAESLLGTGPGWLRSLRGAAIGRARELGLPTRQFEEWRYTNLGGVAETEYRLAERTGAAIGGFSEPDVEWAGRVVFVDGWFEPGLSSVDVPGVSISLLPVDHAPPEVLLGMLWHGVDAARDGLEALAAGMVTAGVMIHAQQAAANGRPICVTFINTGRGGSAVLTAPHVLVVADPDANVSLVEDHVSAAGARGLTLGTTSVSAGEHARVLHALLVRDAPTWTHFSTLRVRQQRSSRVVGHRVITGGDWVRNNVFVSLEGDDADLVLNGLYVPAGRQQHDNHMRVEHRALRCTSRQYYRGLLADEARGVFTGRIFVAPEAQKTDAVQSNANLLLSPAARVWSKPQLEIFADDVKCTHGATTGQLDNDALFYLQARGLREREARLLLLHAFAGECIDRIKNTGLRNWVRGEIGARLTAMLRGAIK
jgi:Fe-S cluster assembly protein SufD